MGIFSICKIGLRIIKLVSGRSCLDTYNSVDSISAPEWEFVISKAQAPAHPLESLTVSLFLSMEWLEIFA